MATTTRARRVLLIEDEPGLVLTLTDRLKSEGYEVGSASDGPAGLERATREPWDVILLDVMLPGASGFDVCRDLRQRGIHTPVIMLTARGQIVDKVLGLKLGADDYLTKPFRGPAAPRVGRVIRADHRAIRQRHHRLQEGDGHAGRQTH
jgi:DNA-binding response OmpR family regulator